MIMLLGDNSKATNQGALHGVLVIDCSQVLAGPYCSMLLGDMGADVIKIEKPTGDDMRRWGPPFIEGESTAFMAVNRNKRSVVLDLKSQHGLATLKRMLQKADVFIENYRLGAMERLGLGYDALTEQNHRLIYCSISGFGRTGPYAKQAGYDLIAQGMSGVMSITGEPGHPPTKVGVPMADLNAGMFAAQGILGALLAREHTRRGQLVDISLLESALAYTVWESSMYFAEGHSPGPLGSTHRLTAPYQAVQCQDGYITIAAPNQDMWERLCRAIGGEQLLAEERFASNGSRMDNHTELEQALETIFATRSRSDWLAILQQAGVAAGPIHSIAEVWNHEQVVARAMQAATKHSRVGVVNNIGSPIGLSDTPNAIRSAAPALGEHTESVISELLKATDELP